MSVLKGYAKWAFITKPNTKYEATYIINVVVTEEIAKVFREKGHLVKQEPEGPAIVVQRKVNGPNGIVRPAPKLLNINNEEIDSLIGNGSFVAVQFNEYSGVSEHGPYKGLDLQAVKILKEVEYTQEDQYEKDGQELLNVTE